MMRTFLCVVFFMALMGRAFAGPELDELNAKFAYKGKPIHPFLVGKLINTLADDRPPMVVSVDVAAAFDSNEYPNSEVKRQYGQWMAERTKIDGDMREYESWGYDWLGKMAGDVHVVEIGTSGGGSGYFMDLLFIKFSEGAISKDGKPQKQILMSVVKTFTLGDRYEGDIKVLPNKVIVPPSKNQHGGGSIDKVTELTIP